MLTFYNVSLLVLFSCSGPESADDSEETEKVGKGFI